jgi:hypothetical protein
MALEQFDDPEQLDTDEGGAVESDKPKFEPKSKKKRK